MFSSRLPASVQQHDSMSQNSVFGNTRNEKESLDNMKPTGALKEMPQLGVTFLLRQHDLMVVWRRAAESWGYRSRVEIYCVIVVEWKGTPGGTDRKGGGLFPGISPGGPHGLCAKLDLFIANCGGPKNISQRATCLWSKIGKK